MVMECVSVSLSSRWLQDLRIPNLLLHLQPEQTCFRAANCVGTLSLPLIKSVTAFVQILYLGLAFLFVVRIPTEAIWVTSTNPFQIRRPLMPTLNGTLLLRYFNWIWEVWRPRTHCQRMTWRICIENVFLSLGPFLDTL